ncbi:barstar family protein [Streptomyces sp. KL116D]|uniref:barstar family protein n=1 Tax=Streptomyces sp. KL116D TaxID=3045152 RepID=UPI0035571797
MNGPGGYFGWNLDALDDCVWRLGAPPSVHFALGFHRPRRGRVWLIPCGFGDRGLRCSTCSWKSLGNGA